MTAQRSTLRLLAPAMLLPALVVLSDEAALRLLRQFGHQGAGQDAAHLVQKQPPEGVVAALVGIFEIVVVPVVRIGGAVVRRLQAFPIAPPPREA